MNRSALPVLLAVVAGLAAGSEAPPLEERLVDCWSIEKPEQRLACFDREAAPLARARAARSITQTPPPAPVREVAPLREAAATPAVAPSQAVEPAPQDIWPVHARITDLRRSGIASYLVLLDNGQSWQHENEYLGQYLQKGDAVTISRAAMGNYRLTRDAGKSKDWIRVNRVR
jgi:hypothetical protein